MIKNNKFTSSACIKAALVVAAACVTSQAAVAAVICASPGLDIPNSIDGVYFNLVTGASGSAGSAVTGWDINPYNNGSGFTFYGTATPNGILASGTAGTTAVAVVVASGAPVSPTPAPNFYNQFQTTAAAFQTAGTRYAGVKFQNESTGVANYAWIEIVSGATAGFPATLSRYCYDDTGAAINAGTTPVSLQNYSVD